MKKIFLSLLIYSCFLTNAFAGKNFNKVLYIIFENTEFPQAIAQPHFKSLTLEGALLNNFHAEIHPSQGNYLALITGTSFDIKHDDFLSMNERHIGDTLEEAKKDWRLYAEDYPGNCYKEMRAKDYARKHNPFILFSNVENNLKRCQKIVNSEQFFNDLKNNKLAEFSMYIPNLKNDGHDTGVAFADNWLKNTFSKLIFPKDLLIIITFDEGHSKANQIYTLLMGANVKRGYKSDRPYNFASLLHMIEKEFHLKTLNTHTSHALLINDVWK